MSSAYENTVFDFDLNFLNQPTPKNAEQDLQARTDKLRKSVIFLKKRVNRVDHYVVAAKAASKQVEDLTNQQKQYKEQCKRHHIEIANFIEKVTRLETEIQAAEVREREKNQTICELENTVVALQTVHTQLKLLVKEKTKQQELIPAKVESKKCKVGVTNNVKKGVESLRKNNSIILTLDKENEKLRKENARIPNLEKEIENLHNTLASKSEKVSNHEIAKTQNLEKEIETLNKENAKISKLEKEIEKLQKDNAKISNLEKEIANLQKENANIPKLKKEIENLQKENAKIPKLVKEIDILRKDNARIANSRDENETLSKQNARISNLEKDIETLRIKNAKIMMENKTLSKEIVKTPIKKDNIETGLSHLASTIKETGKFAQKLTRKYKPLPDRNSEWCDNSEAEDDVFEEPLLSPTRSDIVIAEEYPITEKGFEVSRESDNENSNEVTSVDTGRGSSLANSDTDKNLHSPEYFLNFSPSNRKPIENEAKTKDATMPINESLLEEVEIPPVTIVENKVKPIFREPKSVSCCKDQSKSLSAINQSSCIDTSDKVSSRKEPSLQEKECLEKNNSLRCESHTDMELEAIFSTMKLNYNAVSPIPRTPTRVHEVDSTSSSSELYDKIERCNSLCDKTVDFMRILMGLVLKQGRDRNSAKIIDCDKLIGCFESILNSEQILNENPVLNKNSNIEISHCVLSHNNDKLGSVKANPESSERQREIIQNNKGYSRLTRNVSVPMLQDENQNQLLCDDNNPDTISNPPSHDKDTNVSRNKSVEENLKQLFDDSVSEELMMDSEISEVTNSVRCSRDVVEINQCPIKKRVGKKVKNKKVTKLEKLKKKLEPKYKIKMEKTPSENLRIKHKQCLPIKNKVTENNTSASLNQKDAYEKAVKIMAEMNSRKSADLAKSPKQSKGLLSPKRMVNSNKDINSSNDSQVLQNFPISTRSKRKFSELFDTCTVVLIKDPLLLSPGKAQTSMTHKTEEDSIPTTDRAKEDNSSTNQKENDNAKTQTVKEDNIFTIHRAKKDKNSTQHKCKDKNNPIAHTAKDDNNSTIDTGIEDKNSTIHKGKEDSYFTSHEGEQDNNLIIDNEKEDNESNVEPLRKKCRRSSNEPLIQFKRVLRSGTKRLSTDDNIILSKSKGESDRDVRTDDNIELSKGESNMKSVIGPSASETNTQFNNENTLQCMQVDQHDDSVVSYGDLEVFSEDVLLEKNVSVQVKEVHMDVSACHPKESILCCMIEKYGVETVRPFEKKIPDNTVKQICENIEHHISTIVQTNYNKNAMNNFVVDMRKLNYKHFIAGLIKFLAKPERKLELLGKVLAHPAPPMTAAEQILIYVIDQLKCLRPSVDIVDSVLCSIEFTLFKLNRTPEFNVIESTSHFYAILCRYYQAKSRLRLFILDAMYCIQFKAVPLIKQCLEVWRNTLPLAHLGMAQNPMVTCLVYLLHFYKCEDKFNRVHELRRILSVNYFYKITDWNEKKILEMFKNSIKDLKDISIEKKMLRLALIILAKRQGPHWCQNHLIKNLLQPMIERENVPNNVKVFCVSVIGPLMKPYPIDMKVHCEIAINQLVNILNNNPSPEMEEAAITSMMYINRHDQRSINKTLLSRKMKPISLALEKSLRDYVRAKPLKVWKKNLTANAR